MTITCKYKPQSLQRFIHASRPLCSEWLKTPFKIYVRKGVRYIGERAYYTFEIANLPNNDGDLPRGAFRAFVEEIEASKIFDAIYVENVFHKQTRLIEILGKNKYVKHDLIDSDRECFTSYIKPLTEGREAGFNPLE